MHFHTVSHPFDPYQHPESSINNQPTPQNATSTKPYSALPPHTSLLSPISCRLPSHSPGAHLEARPAPPLPPSIRRANLLQHLPGPRDRRPSHPRTNNRHARIWPPGGPPQSQGRDPGQQQGGAVRPNGSEKGRAGTSSASSASSAPRASTPFVHRAVRAG